MINFYCMFVAPILWGCFRLSCIPSFNIEFSCCPGACSIKFFLRNLRPFCRKLRNFCNLWANLSSKFCRNYKFVIYGSVKFYGIGPWRAKLERSLFKVLWRMTKERKTAATSIHFFSSLNLIFSSRFIFRFKIWSISRWGLSLLKDLSRENES